MSRTCLLLLLVLSVGLMGGTTCHYSSGGGKKKDDDDRPNGEGVEIIVDTRTSRATGTPEPATSEYQAAVVGAALAASVVPLSRLETSDGSERVRPSLDIEEPVSEYTASRRVQATSVGVTPEPTAAIVFATGAVLLVWRLKRRRSA